MVIKKIKANSRKVTGKTKEQVVIIKNEVRSHVTKAIGAAFAFVIAFAWRDAIRKSLDAFVIKMGLPETAFVHEYIVAILLTLVCVIGIIVVSKFSIKKEDRKKVK